METVLLLTDFEGTVLLLLAFLAYVFWKLWNYPK